MAAKFRSRIFTSVLEYGCRKTALLSNPTPFTAKRAHGAALVLTLQSSDCITALPTRTCTSRTATNRLTACRKLWKPAWPLLKEWESWYPATIHRCLGLASARQDKAQLSMIRTTVTVAVPPPWLVQQAFQIPRGLSCLHVH